MAKRRGSDTRCKCKFCKTKIDWLETHPIKGDIWVCSVCKGEFCRECFIEHKGARTYYAMTAGDYPTRCHECFDLDFDEK